ncbi:MAG: hypothetical protein QNJ36_06375 [Calothrix sp. MO_167.B42]|nr:hypothetical protein [Calothrix sp. MO_167.B42]
MNFKRIFGAVVAFALVVALSFGVQVDSASAATNTSLNELSQGGTLVADVPGEKSFEFNTQYFLPQGASLILTNTPQRLVTMVANNLSSNYEGLLLVRYGSEGGFSLQFDANDPNTEIKDFNPRNSRITVTNASTSRSSNMRFSFL